MVNAKQFVNEIRYVDNLSRLIDGYDETAYQLESKIFDKFFTVFDWYRRMARKIGNIAKN